MNRAIGIRLPFYGFVMVGMTIGALIGGLFHIGLSLALPPIAGALLGFWTGRWEMAGGSPGNARRALDRTYPAMGLAVNAGVFQWLLTDLPQSYTLGPAPLVLTAIALLVFVSMIAKAIEAQVAWVQLAYLAAWGLLCEVVGFSDMARLAFLLFVIRVILTRIRWKNWVWID